MNRFPALLALLALAACGSGQAVAVVETTNTRVPEPMQSTTASVVPATSVDTGAAMAAGLEAYAAEKQLQKRAEDDERKQLFESLSKQNPMGGMPMPDLDTDDDSGGGSGGLGEIRPGKSDKKTPRPPKPKKK